MYLTQQKICFLHVENWSTVKKKKKTIPSEKQLSITQRRKISSGCCADDKRSQPQRQRSNSSTGNVLTIRHICRIVFSYLRQGIRNRNGSATLLFH